MIKFINDYQEGAAPEILDALMRTNLEQTVGYGLDEHCFHAAEMIKKRFSCENADVHFLVGGTQVNTTVLAHILRPYEGVVSAETGHVSVHESGAIEATGHEVLTLPAYNGKMCAKDLEAYMIAWTNNITQEHIVKPGAVYISQPTEYGTVYSADELAGLKKVCKEFGLLLYADGARLGYGLSADDTGVEASDMAKYCDLFYIGGTKQGALFGEALVIVNDSVKPFFRNMIKQRGGMLAKGRLLGIQFEELMKDDLYFRLAYGAVEKAQRIRKALMARGASIYIDSPTNQQFLYLKDEQVKYLEQVCEFAVFAETDQGSVYRFCTSWATEDSAVDTLVSAIEKMPD